MDENPHEAPQTEPTAKLQRRRFLAWLIGRVTGIRILLMLVGAGCGYVLGAILAPAVTSSRVERVISDFTPAFWSVGGLILALLIGDFRARRRRRPTGYNVRMDDKPRRFRFGLLALFGLLAAVAVVSSVWNPLPTPSKSNFGLIEVGMTEADVAELVGNPDQTAMDNAKGWLAHTYELDSGEHAAIVNVNGKVFKSLQFWAD